MGREDEYNAIAESIVTHYQNGTTDQSDDVLRVPIADYTDPERWQREIDLVFKKVPLMVAMTCEVPNPGDYKAMEMVGVPLVIARGKDGVVRTFMNVCRHRGAHVCKPGKGNRSRFTCPYHGWTFGNDGRLLAVADQSKFGDIDKADYGLVELPCQERVGLIFACLTPGEAIDVDAWLGGMAEDLEYFDLANKHFFAAREIFGANWKIAYDGYLEGYHIAALHPETINTVTISDLMKFDPFGPHLRVAYGNPNIEEMYELPKDQWWKREDNGFTFVRTLFPNISMYLGYGIGQIAQLIPGPTADKNRTILNYFIPEPPADEAAAKEVEAQVDFLVEVVDTEDYDTGDEIQLGLDARPFDHVLFGRNERGNQYFHKWLDWYLANDPSAPKPTL